MDETRLTPSAPSLGILETVLYATDLDAAREFYADVMGFGVYSQVKGRHVFFKLEGQMLLIFNPGVTLELPKPGGLPVPPHGARGAGHICFAANSAGIDAWRRRLEAQGITIESEFHWPARDEAMRGRSIYFRDPAGNSVEIAEARIWGFSNGETE